MTNRSASNHEPSTAHRPGATDRTAGIRRPATVRRVMAVIVAAALTGALALVSVAAPASAINRFPDVIELPDGFFPEGVAIGKGNTFFASSLADGAIYRGDLRTGEGEVFVEGQPGRLSVGMAVDRRSERLFVAGGPEGSARVYDTGDGTLRADIALGAGFVNDVIVTRHAAYFTNSFAPELYEVPLDRNSDVAGPVRTIPLSGDFQFIPGGFNANGIEFLGRDTLIIVNSAVGALYRVDITTGATTEIDTGGEVVNGDGLLLIGRTVYAVVGGLNQITELRLTPDLERAEVTDVITDSDFDVPTTVARKGRYLYAVNAKFSTPPLPTTPYEVVRVRR